MSIGKGIKLSTGFDLNSKTPLDNRTVFATLVERNMLPDINLYEGLMCYVAETKLNYQYVEGMWQEFKLSGGNSELNHEHTNIEVLNELTNERLGFWDRKSEFSGNYNDLINKPNLDDLGNGTIHVGNEMPQTEDYKVWIDTDDNVQITNGISDAIIDEFRAIINGLKNEVNSLKDKLLEHEVRIEYLEIYGSIGGGTPTNGIQMAFEDGSVMTFEDGSVMTFEDGNVSNGTFFAFDDNSKMSFETNELLTFEEGVM